MRKLIMVGMILAAVGCSPYVPKAPSTVPVKGKILLPNGNPVPGGTAHFKPKNGGGAIQSGVSEIGKDGSFSITSFNKDDGLQPGEYTVTVDPVSYKTGSAVTIKGIPTKYQKASTSDLVVKVDKAEDNLVLRMR